MKQKGFTLIEIIIVISIIGVIGTIVTEMLSRLILVAKKIDLQNEIKNNSETILNQNERIVRNAIKIEYIGSKVGGSWDWQNTSAGNYVCSVSSGAEEGCGFIVQNFNNTSQPYSRFIYLNAINQKTYTNPNQLCPDSVYATQVINISSPTLQTSCNGAVLLSSSSNLLDLITNDETDSIAISNINLTKGVSIQNTQIQINIPSNTPPLMQIDLNLSQPIGITLRDSAEVTRTFTTVISLRNY